MVRDLSPLLLFAPGSVLPAILVNCFRALSFQKIFQLLPE